MATNKDFIVKNGLSVGEDISVSGSVTSNLQFDDSVQLQLGTDSDLLIYHDNSNAYIDDVGSGSLYIRSGTTYFQNAAGTKTSIQTNSGAGQTLFFNNDPIFATLVDGVSITGNAVLTGELRGPASFVIDPAAIGDNTGEVVIKGDLTVEGTTTTINSTTLTVDDKNIVLGSGSANAAAADGAGISVDITGVTNPEWNWYVNSVNTGVSAWESNYPVVITQASTGRTTNLHLVNETSAASTEVALEMSVISPANDACDVRLVAHRRQSNAGSDFYIETTNSSNAIERHFTILEDGNVGIGINLPTVALDVSGDITATGTITGADYSGITMGGSLSGSHDDAKVQYGNSFSGTPAQGHFFFDALNQKLKVYTGSAFVDAVPASGGSGGGSGSSDATATFRKYTYTLASSTNAVSGKEDDEVTTTNFISGRKYEITAVGNTDFTAIGASSNAIGVVFVSTGVGGGTTGKAKEVLFYATGGTQNIEVYVNGVKAVEGSSNDYVATTGTSVTFTSNLSSGDVVDVQVYELLTNDSYYLKSEVYTQAQVNSQITTGTSSYLPLAGGELTGNLVMSGTSPQLQFETSSSNPNFQIAVQESIASTFEISSGATDADATDDTYVPRLSVNANGKVGIGTGSAVPDSMLHVKSGTTDLVAQFESTDQFADIALKDSGGTSYIRQTNGSLFIEADRANASASSIIRFKIDNADMLTIDADGNVNVTGDITAQGALRTDDSRHDTRPTLLLDWANSKQLDNRVAYTRGTTATYYDGLTDIKASENLHKYSEEFSNSYWSTKYNLQSVSSNISGVVAPDGTNTVSSIVENSANSAHYIHSPNSINYLPGDRQYTYSVFAKAGNRSVLGLWTTTVGGGIAYFDLTNGTVTTTTGAYVASARIDSYGNGWYRCSFTTPTNGTGLSSEYPVISMHDGVGNYSYTGNGSSNIYIWGAQVELNSQPSHYIKTTTTRRTLYMPKIQVAAAGKPRFDHDPMTGKCEGLLLEQSSTNLYGYGNTPVGGATGNTTLIQNAGVAPDGSHTAQLIFTPKGSSASGYAYRGASNIIHSGAGSNGGTWTISYYIKRLMGTANIAVGIGSGTHGNLHGYIDSNYNVTISTSGAMTATRGEAIPVGDGWYRVAISGITTGSAGYAEIQAFSPGAYQEFLLWGMQIEADRQETSYIPTSGGTTATRNPDNAYISGNDFLTFFREHEGTFYVESDSKKARNSDSTNNRIDTIHINRQGSFSDSHLVGLNSVGGSNTMYWYLQANSDALGATVAIPDGSDADYNNGKMKFAYGYAPDDFFGTANGETGTSSSNYNAPREMDRIYFGSRDGTSQFQNGRIAKVAYYNRRLSNTQIRNLTKD